MRSLCWPSRGHEHPAPSRRRRCTCWRWLRCSSLSPSPTRRRPTSAAGASRRCLLPRVPCAACAGVGQHDARRDGRRYRHDNGSELSLVALLGAVVSGRFAWLLGQTVHCNAHYRSSPNDVFLVKGLSLNLTSTILRSTGQSNIYTNEYPVVLYEPTHIR